MDRDGAALGRAVKRALRDAGRAWRVVLTVALLECALAWLLASVLLGRAIAPLADSPDAGQTLFAHGGRGLLELGIAHGHALTVLGITLGVAIALYALFALVAGGALIVAVASPPRLGIGRTYRLALGRAPTLIAVAASELLGLLLCAALGAGSIALALHATRPMANEQAADLCVAAAVLPALLLAWAVSVVHDAARVYALTRSTSARASLFAAVGRVAADVARLAGTSGLVGVAAVALTLVGAALAPGLDASWPLVALAALGRVGLIVARVASRAAWLARLGQPWITDSAA